MLPAVSFTSLAEASQGSRFGGPDTTEVRISKDAEQIDGVFQTRILDWDDWKASVKDEHGLSFGPEYSAVALNANEEGFSGKDNAAAGMAKFLGSWELVGRGTADSGALVWKLEHRHKYSSQSPQAFGFDQGYIGLIEPPFSDEGTRLTNLFWRQRFYGGKATVTAGMLDATDYLNLYSLTSPWTGFMNFAFSTGSASMFIPNDATTGIAAGVMLSDEVYAIGGVVNAYTDPTEPFDTFNDFFSEREYFSSIEIGWAPGQQRIFFENAHITLWHVDESDPAGTPGGWGAAFNYSTVLADGRSSPSHPTSSTSSIPPITPSTTVCGLWVCE
jgi:porin